jgi:hypothetical protein
MVKLVLKVHVCLIPVNIQVAQKVVDVNRVFALLTLVPMSLVQIVVFVEMANVSSLVRKSAVALMSIVLMGDAKKKDVRV